MFKVYLLNYKQICIKWSKAKIEYYDAGDKNNGIHAYLVSFSIQISIVYLIYLYISIVT